MKFAYLPKPKDEPIAHLEAQGHTHVALDDYRVVKDNLLAPPPLFKMIREATGTPLREIEVVRVGGGWRYAAVAAIAAAAGVLGSALLHLHL